MSQLDADFLFPRSLHFRFEFALAEEQLGITLPADLQELYLTHNGTGTAFFYSVNSTRHSHRIYPIEAAIGTYGIWATLRKGLEDERRRLGAPSMPETSWWKKDWLPITANHGLDGIFVDLSSDLYGQVCQVTNCCTAGINVEILASDCRTWLDELACQLLSGQCKFDSPCPTLSSGPLWQ
jgi:cell wall assembly regulator SMI1